MRGYLSSVPSSFILLSEAGFSLYNIYLLQNVNFT